MRSTLLALLGSIVLVASSLLIWPADVEAKGKWPMTWKSDDKNWTSERFVMANRQGVTKQYNVLAFTVKKKPGSRSCVATYGARVKNRMLAPLEVRSKAQRPKTFWSVITLNVPDSMPRMVWLKLGVKTNGNCIWKLMLWGPRKGSPPEGWLE